MNYLLDTCVLSEARKPDAAEELITWLEQMSESRLFLSAIVIGEIQQGIASLAEGHKQRSLQAWLDEGLRARFEGRILAIDSEIALEWGELMGNARKIGKPAPVVDALIAATAIRHNLTLVTRNTKDFEVFPVRLLNPWVN
ncbi:MAG: type II toxin-antitoxin system VapC family toxin [Methylococcales bacterium]|nr:type II toxin-antitoxin system VapC family toxin [Methylococcaceae bacterium]